MKGIISGSKESEGETQGAGERSAWKWGRKGWRVARLGDGGVMTGC